MMKYFEDLEVGAKHSFGNYQVTRDEVIEFAKKYDLSLRVVIKPPDSELDEASMAEAYVNEGILVNSGPFNGQRNLEALDSIAEYLESKGL